jgi:Pentapeptide repeats (8 copies)
MPSVTRLARDVLRRSGRSSRQGWQWLIAAREPAAIRAKLAKLIHLLSRTYGGRLAVAALLLVGIVLLLPPVLPRRAQERSWFSEAWNFYKTNKDILGPLLGPLGTILVGIGTVTVGVGTMWVSRRQAQTGARQAETAAQQVQIAERQAAMAAQTAARQAETAAQTEARRAETAAKQAHTTERYATATAFYNAVSRLAGDVMEGRLGGVYLLEHIARDSLDDHRPVMETLTAFVRERARWKPDDLPAYYEGARTDPTEPATDIAAALTVIGRRSEVGRDLEKEEGWQLNLNRTDLRGADLLKAHLDGASLRWAHLERAVLRGAHLERAVLTEAHLEGADLGDAEGLSQAQIDQAFGDAETVLPPGLIRPTHWTQPKRGAEPAP